MSEILEVLKYSLGLVGVFLGWGLTQLTEHFKVAREDKRKVKKTIFYLLEVRHQLSMFMLHDEQVSDYLPIIKKFLPQMFEVVPEEQIKNFIRQFVEKAFGDKPLSSDKEIDALSVNYAKCIENLSEIDPVLAFRLYGRQNIRTLLKDVIDRSTTSLTEMQVSDVDSAVSALGKMSPNVLKQIILDLDDVLLQLSKKVGKRTYKEVKGRLTFTQNTKHSAEREKFVQEMLKGIMSPESK